MSNWLFWLLAVIVSFGLNYFVCVITWYLKTHVMTDATYASTFVVLVLMAAFWRGNHFNWVKFLVLISIIIWALRLGVFLFDRIWQIKFDARLQQFDKKFSKWFVFWSLQATAVLLLTAPFLYVLSSVPDAKLAQNFWLIALWVGAMIGLICEVIADWQKRQFYKYKKSSPTGFISNGLWKFSRHPNYLGDILFWWLLWLFMTSQIWAQDHFKNSWPLILGALSPLWQNVLLVLVSGIPILERNAWKKRITNRDYRQYVQKTPILVPLIGKKGLPRTVKNWLKKRNLLSSGTDG